MFELSGPAEGYVSFALSQDKWMVKYTDAYNNFLCHNLLYNIYYFDLL